MPNISIYCEAGEKAGLGHVTRMKHLKQAFQDHGLKTYLNAAADDGSAGKWNPSRNADIVIIDVPNNDDELLLKARWLLPAAKIVVFVGVGKTITQRTLWLADLVIYQTIDAIRITSSWPFPLANKIVSGAWWIMVNPAIQRPRTGMGTIMYFGAGYSRDYVFGFRRTVEDGGLIHGNPVPENAWVDMLRASRDYIGTMGMAAYDAAAAGCRITVICRTEEHLADAKAAGFSIAGLGEPSIEQIQKAWHRAKTCDLIDSAGVYRVAEKILELAKT